MESLFTEIDEKFICEHCGHRSAKNLVIHVETIATFAYIQSMLIKTQETEQKKMPWNVRTNWDRD